MGWIMKEDDIYIGSLLDLLNLRFAPSQGEGPDWFGGIDEIVALQKQFQIFQRKRSFKDSVALLNLGGMWSPRVKNRWYALLDDLSSYDSNVKGLNGDSRIVRAIIDNLAAPKPLPIYFKAHDSRASADAKRVIAGEETRPLFYLEQDYLTISLPMKPRTAPAKRGTRTRRKAQ
jgi:hypothetical protein